MADTLTPEKRSVNMSRIRSRDMKPEIAVRKLVHSMGHRYRLHRKDFPGRPDLVFGPKKKIIFVHGCFWHQHSILNCLDGRKPKSNTGYWNDKLDKNVKRDKKNQNLLKKLGWEVLVIWECETNKNLEELKQKIQKFLDY